MLNLLVVENDPNVCKRLVNNVTMYVKNIRVSGISYTAKEAIEIIKKQKINIIILDYDLPNSTADSLLKYLDKNKLEDRIPTLVLAKKTDEEKIKDSESIYKVICKPIKVAPIVYGLRELSGSSTAIKQALIKDRINKELEKLQYNFSYVGTKYMAEAIYEIYTKNYIYKGGNLSKNVYPIIAENHNTSVNNVKCNITSATKCMTQRCPKDMMDNYLFCEDGDSPKVKEIMYKVINRL